MSGFASPNYTQVPNDLFEMMPDMGEAELRVTLTAVRKLVGFHKRYEAISLSQFQRATGLSRQGVIDGLKAAIERGTIRELEQKGRRGVHLYELIIEDDQSTQLTSTGQDSRPVLVKTVDTQKKDLKRKSLKHTLAPSGAGEPISVPKPKPRNEWYDAVYEVWGYTEALNVETGKMLQGISTRKAFKDYNINPPMTSPSELLEWARWYRREKLGDKPDLNMLAKRMEVQSSITEWRRSKAAQNEEVSWRVGNIRVMNDPALPEGFKL